MILVQDRNAKAAPLASQNAIDGCANVDVGVVLGPLLGDVNGSVVNLKSVQTHLGLVEHGKDHVGRVPWGQELDGLGVVGNSRVEVAVGIVGLNLALNIGERQMVDIVALVGSELLDWH